MRASNYSRRRFLHAGTTGVAATVVAATTSARGAIRAGTQEPPSAATAPRILRKPPLPELARIAKFYNLDLSRDDLTSFRNLMDGVLASYRRLDQFTEPTFEGEVPAGRGLPSTCLGQSVKRLVLEVLAQRRNVRASRGQENRHQRQCVRGRHPDDERFQRAGGLRPDVDATIVTRILDAGGEVVGKAVCEHLLGRQPYLRHWARAQSARPEEMVAPRLS